MICHEEIMCDGKITRDRCSTRNIGCRHGAERDPGAVSHTDLA